MQKLEDDDFKAPSPVTKAAANHDLEVEFGNTAITTIVGDLDKVPAPTKDRSERVALLTQIQKPLVAWVHYTEINAKKGMYRCLSTRDKDNRIIEKGVCCQQLEKDDKQKAQLAFATLAVHYTNAPNDGKYPAATEAGPAPTAAKVKAFKLSRNAFIEVGKLVFEGEKASDFDFLITKKESFGYDYNRLTKKAPRYAGIPELNEQILKEAREADIDKLRQLLGKVVTAVEFKAILAGSSTKADPSKIDNTDDL